MASGRLGSIDLPSSINTTLYTVPASKIATFNVNVCNRGAAAVNMNLAISSTGTPSSGEYIEYNAVIPAHGTLERTGLVAQAGMNVVAYGYNTGLSVNAYGFEEAA